MSIVTSNFFGTNAMSILSGSSSSSVSLSSSISSAHHGHAQPDLVCNAIQEAALSEKIRQLEGTCSQMADEMGEIRSDMQKANMSVDSVLMQLADLTSKVFTLNFCKSKVI